MMERGAQIAGSVPVLGATTLSVSSLNDRSVSGLTENSVSPSGESIGHRTNASGASGAAVAGDMRQAVGACYGFQRTPASLQNDVVFALPSDTHAPSMSCRLPIGSSMLTV